MALKVWLPLTGDLENIGVSDIAITNNGATVNTSGKIGSCYAFNGSSNYLYSTYNFYNTTYSISAWIYTTSGSATQTIVCDRTAVGSGFSTFLIGGKLRIDAGGNNLQWTTNYSYPTNTWFHLTVTYDGTNVSYYINGEFKETKVQAIASTYWGSVTSMGASQANGSGYGNFLNGRLNDVRIYDHCLSAKEVKEIAQELVLHYKLDDLTHGAIDSSGFGHNGSLLSAPTTSTDNGGKYSQSVSFDGTDDGILIENIILSPIINDKVTYSFWIKPNGENGARSVYFGSYSGTSWSIEKNANNLLRLYWNGSPDEVCTGATITDGA